MAKRNIVGVVLAGGRSSRMGRDKAFLDYGGKPLIDHMVGLLQKTGLDDIYVSGDIEGYRCIPDTKEFKGPACAIKGVLAELTQYDGVLFVPVDMPLLSPDILKLLLQSEEGGYYKKWPLPVLIAQPCAIENAYSVQKLLDDLGISPIEIPEQYKDAMRNFNTPEDWQKVA